MKVIRINDYNAPALLEDASTPEIGVDEVLVRVQAAALNPLDVKLQSGALREMMPLSFPYALGTDLAGTIERAGPLAEHWHEGDKVVARLDPAKGGAMAEFAVVPVVQLAAGPRPSRRRKRRAFRRQAAPPGRHYSRQRA